MLVISDFRYAHTARPEAEIFLSLAERGVEIDVVTVIPSEYATRFESAGMRVFDCYPKAKFDKRAVRAIRKLLLVGQYDIVQLMARRAIYAGIQAAKGVDIAIVTYRGSSLPVNWFNPFSYLKHLNPRVDKIICNSTEVADMFRRQLFFSRDKAVVIYKGHDPEWYRGTVPANLEHLGIPPDAVVCCYAANRHKFKGFHVLLEAISLLRSDAKVHFIIMGRDTDSDTLRSAINRTGMVDQVHFLGFVDNPLPWIAASDVILLSSINSEALNKSVIEGMCLGKAPIITDIPGNADLLEHGQSGIKVPPGNAAALAEAIALVARDPELRRTLSENAREHVRTRLHHKTTVDQIYDLYLRLTTTR